MKNLIKTYDNFINDTYTQETAFIAIKNVLNKNNYTIEFNDYDYGYEGQCLCLNVYKDYGPNYEDRIYYYDSEYKEIKNLLKFKLYVKLVKSNLFKGLFENAII